MATAAHLVRQLIHARWVLEDLEPGSDGETAGLRGWAIDDRMSGTSMRSAVRRVTLPSMVAPSAAIAR